MGKIARCWIAEGRSKSVEGVSKAAEMIQKRQRTVSVDAAEEILFQTEFVESRND